MENKLIIDQKTVDKLHHYISTSPTGRHDFSVAYDLLAALEQLPPLKAAEQK